MCWERGMAFSMYYTESVDSEKIFCHCLSIPRFYVAEFQICRFSHLALDPKMGCSSITYYVI